MFERIRNFFRSINPPAVVPGAEPRPDSAAMRELKRLPPAPPGKRYCLGLDMRWSLVDIGGPIERGTMLAAHVLPAGKPKRRSPNRKSKKRARAK